MTKLDCGRPAVLATCLAVLSIPAVADATPTIGRAFDSRVSSMADGASQALPAVAWATFEKAIERDRYQAIAANVGEEGVLSAPNPAQGFTTRFAGDGIRLRSLRSELEIGLRLLGYGYAGHMQPPAAGRPEAEGQRVEIARGPLTEWYVNRPGGLEQGFTVGERPRGAGEGPLRIELEVSGAEALSDADGTAVLLGPPGTETRLRYAGLRSWDAEGTRLGSTLGVSGQTIVLLIDDARAVYPLTVDPTVTEDAKLTASDGAALDLFSESLAISGTTVVVGAYWDDDNGGNSGSAYIFEEPVGGWSGSLSETAKLTASDGTMSEQFGFSVAVSGTTVVVGAAEDGFGSAYVFEEPAGGWTGSLNETAKLTASDGTFFDRFGFSVAVDGTTVVVGAAEDDAPGANSGSAYIFVEPAGGWAGSLNESAKLTASDGAAFDVFGFSVAVSGSTVVVGASGDDDNGTDSGSAYIFEEPVGGWSGSLSETAKLTASDVGMPLGSPVFFGRSVSISGTKVVVGALGDDDNGTDSGSAYVFEEPAGGWSGSLSETAKLTASDAETGDQLGESVAVSGTAVVVGAVGDGVNVGAAYVFNEPLGGWSGSLNETGKLLASDGVSGDVLGGAVAVSGTTVVVGAVGDDDNGSSSGSAYVYDLACNDADGDGFGDPGGALCPAGPEADCDDANDQVFPGATEACNGVDDDCDDEVDEGTVDSDGDGVCDDLDLCPGFDDGEDDDNDDIPNGCDLCFGDNATGDSDGDGVCDDVDQCQGDDSTGDGDGDGVCADRDCDDGDPGVAFLDGCGICGGDNSTCGIFEDGFESGDTSAWSSSQP